MRLSYVGDLAGLFSSSHRERGRCELDVAIFLARLDSCCAMESFWRRRPVTIALAVLLVLMVLLTIAVIGGAYGCIFGPQILPQHFLLLMGTSSCRYDAWAWVFTACGVFRIKNPMISKARSFFPFYSFFGLSMASLWDMEVPFSLSSCRFLFQQRAGVAFFSFCLCPLLLRNVPSFY